MRGSPAIQPLNLLQLNQLNQVSYLELYNDQMYDLLSDNPANSDSLAILDDASGGTYVSGIATYDRVGRIHGGKQCNADDSEEGLGPPASASSLL